MTTSEDESISSENESEVCSISEEDTEDESENVLNEEAEPEDFSNDGKFPNTYQIKCEEAVSLKEVYVLHLCASFQNENIKLVAGLSDYQCAIYDISNGLDKNSVFEAHGNIITGVKFANDGNLFYTGSLDGTIKLWDLRALGKPSTVFKDDTDGEDSLKPINCFDLSCDGKFIGAGTLLVDADAYVLFWDTRNPKVLGGYWETHIDDVTDIKFNPVKANCMMSGSTDGLINVFDVSESNEDDALQNSLNTESSIRKIEWLNLKNEDRIGCITDMESLQLWNKEDAGPCNEFSRELLGSKMFVRSTDNAYVTNIHQARYDGNEEVIILGGSNAHKGEYMKSLVLGDGDLEAHGNFNHNKQIVRCSCYKDDIFITGGENGIISVWEKTNSYSNKIQLKERAKVGRVSR